jgi:ATP-dependent helicase HrpB
LADTPSTAGGPPLPIDDLRGEIVAALGRSPRLILHAPTGSGKSTRVPQFLLDGGLLGEGECVVLQPRRIAARLLARWVAQSRGERLGETVGYQIRFENATSAATRIRYVTEGVLLRKMLADPELRGVSAIVFDEFHERHIDADISLARAVALQASARPDLRLVAMSATLDSARLADYLAPCETLSSEGRTHPVRISHLDKAPDPEREPVWETAAKAAVQLQREVEGDLLVFMPGAFEIARTSDALRAMTSQTVILPLHGELAADQQDAAVARYDRPKIVVATNVAETSLTIDGIVGVIDSGLARIARFDPHRGIDTLLVEKISRASADQRAGRAGRTAPGRCVRLWTARDHEHRPAHDTPEIHRIDLAGHLLALKAAGVTDAAAFRWFDPPEPHNLARAESLLRDLGAADASGGITPLGRRMLAFPIHPRYARLLLEADRLRCLPQAALVAALTQARPILRRNVESATGQRRSDLLGDKASSDFLILTRAFTLAERSGFNPDACGRVGVNPGAAREVARIRDQLLRLAREEGLSDEPGEPSDATLGRVVLAAFSDQLARRIDSGTLRCDLVHGRRGTLARESAVRDAPLFVAAEIREVSGRDREVQTLLTLATAIDETWLRELFPGDFSEATDTAFDPVQKRVIARRVTRFRDLALRDEPGGAPEPSAAAALLARKALERTCPVDEWNDAVEAWILRLNRLAEWMPELGLPPIDDAARLAMLGEICFGATSAREIKSRPVWGAVKGWLTPAQQALLDRHAPERIELPNGKKWRLRYGKTGPPALSARIQELYDLERSPTVAAGRVTVVAEILAPNQRPQQVTTDLAGFWRETYPKLKAELQRRYPKHEWR